MPDKVKTWVAWLVVAFLVFAVITNPDQAANVVHSVWNALWGAIQGILRFFSRLAS